MNTRTPAVIAQAAASRLAGVRAQRPAPLGFALLALALLALGLVPLAARA